MNKENEKALDEMIKRSFQISKEMNISIIDVIDSSLIRVEATKNK